MRETSWMGGLTVSRDQDGDDETVDLQHAGKNVSRRRTGTSLRTAMIPAMTTGIEHFIIKSGRRTDMAEMPTPDLAVP